ncbi:MAG: DoxX family membrane protein [Candidatus Paceibacterota bacterium]
MNKKILLLASFFGLTPLLASAHVKWFAEPVGYVRPYEITDVPVTIWIISIFAIVLLGVYLDKKLKVPSWILSHLTRLAPVALSLASVGFGLAFLIFSYNGFIFAPNLPAEGTLGTALIALQALAGVMFLFGIHERVGALLLIVLFGLGVKEFGSHEMIDTLEMLGFAVYALIIGRPRWHLVETKWIQPYVHKLRPYGLPLLRVGTGLNLMVLAFTEKIFAPELTQDFLAHHPWNFMQALGFESFTDYWFAFSAGMGEFIFGLFFLLGLVTRLTTLALAGFLLTTLVLLGPIELIGHLPHFSIAIALLFLGAGSRFTLLKHRT